jgi:hypothetical protein
VESFKHWIIVAWLLALAVAQAQTDAPPDNARFVTVEKDVQLEVLDWGGSGRSATLPCAMTK